MALHGLLPIAEIEFADFIHPAFDQIVSEAARMRYRTNGDWSCPLVVRTPCGGGIHGALYHSQSIEAFYAHVPGLKVVMPSTPADAAGLLRAAIRDPDPVVFLEHKRCYRAITGEVPEGDHLETIGIADIKRHGTDLSVITYGYEVHRCLEAADRLAEDEGIEVEIVDVRSLAPLDTATILASVRSTSRAMVVYEDNRTYGAGAEITGHDRGARHVRPRCATRADRRSGHPCDALRCTARALLHRARARSSVRRDARSRALLRRRGSCGKHVQSPGLVPIPLATCPDQMRCARTSPLRRGAMSCWSSRRLPCCSSSVWPSTCTTASSRCSRSLESGDELIGLLMLTLAGLAVIAVRRARGVAEQTAQRVIADERLTALIAESPVVSYSWDPAEHRYLYLSPQIETLFGVSGEDHAADWSSLIHPEDLDRVLGVSAEADRAATTYLVEYRIVRPDGAVRWIHDESHYHHPGADGRPTLAQGVMFDITERKEAEARAAEAEERYRTLVERVPAIAYSWDTAFAPGTAPADYISPQVERLIGVRAQDWLDDPTAWAGRVHPNDLDRITSAWDAATAAGVAFSEEYRLRTSSGAWLWVRDDANPVGPGAHGAPIYQGVIIDITERRTAEEEVRSAERRWRLLLEHLPMVAYQVSFDEAGAAVDRWVAGGIYRLVGLTALEWLADSDVWDDLIHEDDRDDVLDAWKDLKTHGAPFDRQYRLRRRDGEVVWVHDRAVIAEREGVRVIEGAFADITARHDAEVALAAAEDRFRTLVEQLPAITFIEDIETGANLYVSPQIEDVYGYTAEEWAAEPDLWEQRLHPDDRDWVIASNAADSGDEWSVDYRSLRKDGSLVWIHNDARLIRDAEGTPLYWQGVAYDITERKVAEERLREAEERYRTLVEQLPVAVYTDAVDDLSTAVYISPQYEQLTGYTAEQRLLDPDLWVKMLHPEDRDRVLARSVQTNETGEPFDIDYRIVAADGRVVWLHDHAMQVTDPSGQPRWHGVLQDITESKRSAETIARRDAILEATGLAAERFLRARSWQEHLHEVLAGLGRAGQATRCAVFRNHPLPTGELAGSFVDVWIADGHRLEDDGTLDGFAWVSGGFGRWVEEMSAGRPIHGAVATFPAQERAALEGGRLSIRSVVAIPIFVENTWWGYISFDHVDEDRRWSDADVEALSLTASTIGAAIERERAVGRLDEAQALYRTLIEQLPAVTYIEELGTGDETYSSPQTEALLGYTADEWGPHAKWVEALHPEDRAWVVAEDEKLGDTGEPYRSEYRMLTKGGDVVWVRDEATLVHDAEGTPRYWQGVRFDITAEKEAERQLRQTEERYRQLVEEMPAITYLDEYEPDGSLWPTRYISPQVETIIGFTPEEWIEDPWRWREMVHPDDREMALAADVEHYERGEPLDVELRFYDRAGRLHWLRDQAVLIRDDDGRPRFSQGIIQDITERKQAELAMLDAERRYRTLIESIPAVTYIDTLEEPWSTVYVSPQVRSTFGFEPDAWRAARAVVRSGARRRCRRRP